MPSFKSLTLRRRLLHLSTSLHPFTTNNHDAGATACTACPADKGFLGRAATSEAACDTAHLPDAALTVTETISVRFASLNNGDFSSAGVASDPRVVQVRGGSTASTASIAADDWGSSAQHEPALASTCAPQVRSGESVVPPFTEVGSGEDTKLVDYAVYARPDGSWLINVQRTDGYVVTCEAAAGTASADCEYWRDTAASEDSAAMLYNKLTLDLSRVQGGGGGGRSGGGGGGSARSDGGSTAQVPGPSSPGSSVGSPGAASPAGGSPSGTPSAGSSGSGGGGSGGSGASVGSRTSVSLVWVVAALAACLAMQAR